MKFHIALAGNPNAGKTTVFNGLTGSHQHVGNYPGITVEKKVGQARCNGAILEIVDLPGTYSLTAYTLEEVVTRSVLADEKPNSVIDVLNASALERNLYLSVQLLEMGVPVILALNMMDEARALGLRIDTEELSRRLHLPVVEMVARRGEGMKELLQATVKDVAARQHEKREALRISYGPDLDPLLNELENAIDDAGLLKERYIARWVALKFLEGDSEIRSQCRLADLELTQKLEVRVDEVGDHLKKTLGTYPEAIVADYRYGFIASVLRDGVITRAADTAGRVALSDKLDRILTQQLLGPLILLGILFLVYEITFVLGAYPMTLVEKFFDLLKDVVGGVLPEGLFRSLIVSGILDGVGGVMSFVPLIMLIFLQIAFLENAG